MRLVNIHLFIFNKNKTTKQTGFDSRTALLQLLNHRTKIGRLIFYNASQDFIHLTLRNRL